MNFLGKKLITIIITLLILGGIFILPIKKSQAVGEFDFMNWLQNTFGVGQETAQTGIQAKEQLEKMVEKAFKEMWHMARKQFLNMLTNDIINWIQGGMFEGEKFVVDLEDYMLKAHEAGQAALIRELGLSRLCEPFSFEIRSAFGKAKTFPEEIGCTIFDILNTQMTSFQEFMKNFQKGGFASFIKLGDPNNNIYSVYLSALDRQIGLHTGATEINKMTYLAGMGFTGEEICVRAHDKDNQKLVYDRSAIKENWPNGLPNYIVCDQKTTITPGYISAEALAKAANLDIDWLLTAEEFGEYAGAILDAFTTRIIQEGLAEMATDKGTTTEPKYTYRARGNPPQFEGEIAKQASGVKLSFAQKELKRVIKENYASYASQKESSLTNMRDYSTTVFDNLANRVIDVLSPPSGYSSCELKFLPDTDDGKDLRKKIGLYDVPEGSPIEGWQELVDGEGITYTITSPHLENSTPKALSGNDCNDLQITPSVSENYCIWGFKEYNSPVLCRYKRVTKNDYKISVLININDIGETNLELSFSRDEIARTADIRLWEDFGIDPLHYPCPNPPIDDTLFTSKIFTSPYDFVKTFKNTIYKSPSNEELALSNKITGSIGIAQPKWYIPGIPAAERILYETKEACLPNLPDGYICVQWDPTQDSYLNQWIANLDNAIAKSEVFAEKQALYQKYLAKAEHKDSHLKEKISEVEVKGLKNLFETKKQLKTELDKIKGEMETAAPKWYWQDTAGHVSTNRINTKAECLGQAPQSPWPSVCLEEQPSELYLEKKEQFEKQEKEYKEFSDIYKEALDNTYGKPHPDYQNAYDYFLILSSPLSPLVNNLFDPLTTNIDLKQRVEAVHLKGAAKLYGYFDLSQAPVDLGVGPEKLFENPAYDPATNPDAPQENRALLSEELDQLVEESFTPESLLGEGISSSEEIKIKFLHIFMQEGINWFAEKQETALEEAVKPAQLASAELWQSKDQAVSDEINDLIEAFQEKAKKIYDESQGGYSNPLEDDFKKRAQLWTIFNVFVGVKWCVAIPAEPTTTSSSESSGESSSGYWEPETTEEESAIPEGEGGY